METTFSAAGDTSNSKSVSPIQISFGEEVQGLVNSSPSSTSPTNRIISERKRRQKLGQSIISLSALIPGLKKMDKASILEEAIQYLKQLEERVTPLEKNIGCISEWGLMIMTNGEGCKEKVDWLEINVRLSGKSILINVYCEKIEGFEAMILIEIAKFGLSIVNASFLTFGLSHVEATIVTQMGSDFNMPIEDLATSLQSIVSSFVARSRGCCSITI